MNLFSSPVRFGPPALYGGGGYGLGNVFAQQIAAPHAPTANVPGALTNVAGLVPGQIGPRPGAVLFLPARTIGSRF